MLYRLQGNGGTENGIDVFEGAIARLDIWDKALSPKELLQFAEKLPDTASGEDHPRAVFFFQDSFVNLTDFIPAGRRRGIYIGMTNAEAAKEGEHERETDDSQNPYADIKIPSQLRTLAIREYLERFGEVNLDTLPEHFFAVNHFEKDGRIYFVIHQAEGSYIISDMVKDDDDPDIEYILWMIELIIIVVGGVCSILFGLHPTTGQDVVNYIRQNIVNIPGLRAIFMGAAKAAVATKCVEFLLELHHQNVLKSLLRVMFSVSFFTLIRVGITLIARALGGLAGLAVEIAALAVSVAIHLAKYPSAPFALEEILFHEKTIQSVPLCAAMTIYPSWMERSGERKKRSRIRCCIA